MRVLIIKPAGSLSEECCCGASYAPHLPCQSIITSQFLKNNGVSADFVDLTFKPMPDITRYDHTIIWISVLDTLFDELDLISQIKRAGRLTIGVLNDPFGLEKFILDYCPDLDIIVNLYDREKTILTLLQTLENSPDKLYTMNGIMARREDNSMYDGKEVRPPGGDLSFLSSAVDVYKTIPVHRYKHHWVLTGKGCRYGCSFCEYSCTPVRKRCISDIIAEIAYLCSHHVRVINLLDLHLFNDPDWARELLKTLAKMRFPCQFGLNVRLEDLFDLNKIELLKRAGTLTVSIGIESLSSDLLKNINKKNRTAKIDIAMKNLSKARIIPHCNFLLGIPGQRQSDLDEIEIFAKKTPFKFVHLNNLIPRFNSPLFQTIAENDNLITASLDAYVNGLQHPFVKTDYLSVEDITAFTQKINNWFSTPTANIRYARARLFRINWAMGLKMVLKRKAYLARRM